MTQLSVIMKEMVYDCYRKTKKSYINMGWKVVSITPVSVKAGYSNPTEYVIVIFEKEE